MRHHLRRGALAGLAGGLASMLVLLLVGERSLSQAITLEHRAGVGAHDELFGRTAQLVGGSLGVVLAGVALGLIFAVVFAAIRPVGGDWRGAVALALVSFVAVFFLPWIKYPANPPGVGNPASVDRRTGLYLVLLAWSVISMWAAWRVAAWGRARAWPEHLRLPAGMAAYVVLAVAGLALLPGNPDPVRAPAELVWRFRLASLGGASAFWAVCGTVFGWLSLPAKPRRDEAVAPSPTASSRWPSV